MLGLYILAYRMKWRSALLVICADVFGRQKVLSAYAQSTQRQQCIINYYRVCQKQYLRIPLQKLILMNSDNNLYESCYVQVRAVNIFASVCPPCVKHAEAVIDAVQADIFSPVAHSGFIAMFCPLIDYLHDRIHSQSSIPF